MPRTIEDFVDLTIPGLSGRDLIIGLSDGKPVDNVRWRSLVLSVITCFGISASSDG